VSDQGIIADTRGLQEHIYEFYHNLMGAEGENRILSLAHNTWDAGKLILEYENNGLMLLFSGEEIDEVLKSMKVDTTPGPDGFPVMFFKKFWSLVKPYILDILNGFALGRVDIARLNLRVFTLIPKVHGAEDIRQFRPIVLINVIFKFVAKAYAIWLSPIVHRTIGRTQTTFVKGHHIHEGIVSLMEIIHETKSKRIRGVFLKLDFEKAYDRVNWSFLRKDFDPG
jgi:hypothetical protein